MAEKIGAGLVGMGWAAGEHFKAYQHNPHTRMRGVCSRTVEGAQAKLDELSAEVDVAGVQVYETYEEMLENPDIQVISITSPPSRHVDQAIAAAQAGKHLCLEKAIALSLADLRRLEAEVGPTGVKTAVCLECHYSPQVITIKSLLSMGIIGEVYYLESDYYHGIGPWYKQWSWNVTPEEGGSALLSAGLHAVDLVLYFVDSEVVEVCSYSCKSPHNPLQYQYDPNAVTILKFANGVVGKCAASVEYRGPYYFPFEIHGEAGVIRDNKVFSTKLGGQQDFAEIPTIMLDSGDVTHHPYQDEIDELVDCILEDRQHSINLGYAARTHEVVFAADRSAAEGRPILLEEIRAE